MSVENNEAILATTWNQEAVQKVRDWVAKEILDDDYISLFVFVPAVCEGKTTILMAPCGSKKGWSEDKIASDLRDKFIRLLESFNYEDGSNPWDWIEVGYGEFGQKVLRGNCKNCYNDREYCAD